MRILLIDNYDSFTYNLYHLVRSVSSVDDSVDVVYNDVVAVGSAFGYDRIIISPGPGVPSDAGCITDIVRELAPSVPVLGICLGHQAIAEAFGGGISRLECPLHGIRDRVTVLDRSGIFRDAPSTIMAGRYHSWIVRDCNLPECLKVTAVDDRGAIMAVAHKSFPVYGVQFHPESVMTDCGGLILRNFIEG